MRIIRHEIDIVDHQTIRLPASGWLLSVAVSRTAPDFAIGVWSVDYEVGEPTEIDVYVIGTGNPVRGAAADAVMYGKFVGTVVTPSQLVWHVWQGRIS